MPAATHVRERLLAGKEVSNRDIQIEFGISNDHCVSDVATRLTREGHNLVKEKRIETSQNGRPVTKVFWRVQPKGRSTKMPMPPRAMGPKNPSPQPSVSAQIRQRLLNGDSISARQAADEYRVSRSLLGVVLAQMRQEGYRLDGEKIEGGQVRFRLADRHSVASGDLNTPDPPRKRPKKTFSKKAIYADLVKRFEAGERIDAHMVMNDYGVESLRFLATFLGVQRKKGWIFTRTSKSTETGWRTVYRLKWAKPKKTPPKWVEEASNEPQQIVDLTDPEEVEFAEALEQFEGSPVPPMVLPQLGTTLRVTLLAEGDEGEIVLGLKNGQASWMVTLRS